MSNFFIVTTDKSEVNLYIFFRLNSSFRPLTFTKLRFWPPKIKKTTEPPPKFCNCSSFGPPRSKKNKHMTPHLGCHVSVDRVKSAQSHCRSQHTMNS